MLSENNLDLCIGLTNMLIFELENNLNINQTLYYYCKELGFYYITTKQMFNYYSKDILFNHLNECLTILNNYKNNNYD